MGAEVAGMAGETDAAERLYTAAAVRELDRRAIEDHGIDGYALMKAAGAAAFRLLRLRWPGARRIGVVCGGGNNGGDGLVVARLAIAAGLAPMVVLTRAPERLSGSAARAWEDFTAAGGTLLPGADFDRTACDVIVDALLGTGLDRPVEGTAADLIGRINAAARPVLAVDIPSGLSADSGAVLGTGVRAHATITFIGRKRGLHTGAAPAVTGPVFLDALDTPPAIHRAVEPWVARIGADDVRRRLPRRALTAHKGSAGRVLVVGGNHGMGGAVRMAGEAALRSGAGLVTVATRPAHTAALSAARPELMACGVEDPARELPPLLSTADAVVLGPGLGRDDWARAALETVLAGGCARGVLDADALNGIAAADSVVPADWILTPHPGEAARLLDTGVETVENDRFAALEAIVARHGTAVVLKGAGTIVGAPGARTGLVDIANPAMATGGVGDILAGVIGGLLAQGCEAADAAIAGAWLHARSGLQAAAGGDCGLVASDLMVPLAALRSGLHRA